MLNKILSITLIVATVYAAGVERYFTTKLDHFSLGEEVNFRMRYIINDQFWNSAANDPTKPRPILFYCGNEGDIWQFYNNTGFITQTLADRWGALVVFGEHRYFGKSFPYPKSEALKSPFNKFLTVDNTLLDYASLLKMIRAQYGAENKAVIAVGGSYGGMLAAWMRMKFPHAVQGALAASAPIFYFKDAEGAPETKFYEIATKDFGDVLPEEQCSNGIQEGFHDMFTVIKNNTALWDEFSTLMKLCEGIDQAGDIDSLYNHISAGFMYEAMTDYPTEANFLRPMPAWPVNVSCEFFKNVPNT